MKQLLYRKSTSSSSCITKPLRSVYFQMNFQLRKHANHKIDLSNAEKNLKTFTFILFAAYLFSRMKVHHTCIRQLFIHVSFTSVRHSQEEPYCPNCIKLDACSEHISLKEFRFEQNLFLIFNSIKCSYIF